MDEKALAKGIEVEREHKSTYEWIKKLFEEGESFPEEDEFYGMIASDHLEEMSDYYERLEKIESKIGLQEAVPISVLAKQLFGDNPPPRLLDDPSYLQDHTLVTTQGAKFEIPRGMTPKDLLKTMITQLWTTSIPAEAKERFTNLKIVDKNPKTGQLRLAPETWENGIERYLHANPKIAAVLQRIIDKPVTAEDTGKVMKDDPAPLGLKGTPLSRSQVYQKASR